MRVQKLKTTKLKSTKLKTTKVTTMTVTLEIRYLLRATVKHRLMYPSTLKQS